MKQNDCCIVIPIYKAKLDLCEEIILKRIFTKLKRYSHCFIAPYDLNLKYYAAIWPKCPSVTFIDWHSDSLSDYNRLLMQSSFYQTFILYKYILIFQLDGFLLKGEDELNLFLQLNYDYIGAPWPGEGFCYCKRVIPGSGHIPFLRKLQGETVCKVGNGGVSLRKVQSMMNFCAAWNSEAEVWDKAEDIFISFYGQKRKCRLDIAPADIASEFSLETNMKEEIEKGNVPFAVHKWNRYYPELIEKVELC